MKLDTMLGFQLKNEVKKTVKKRDLSESVAKRDLSSSGDMKLSLNMDQMNLLNDIISALQSLNRRKRSLNSEQAPGKMFLSKGDALRAARMMFLNSKQQQQQLESAGQTQEQSLQSSGSNLQSKLEAAMLSAAESSNLQSSLKSNSAQTENSTQ